MRKMLKIKYCDEYDPKVISYRSRLNFKVKSLRSIENIAFLNNADSVWADHITTELKKVKLPKLQINRFFGEPDKFLESI